MTRTDRKGPGVHHVQVNGATVYFTFGYLFGPCLTDSDGDPLKRQPGERNPFWRPFEAWLFEWSAMHPNPYTQPRPRLSAQFNRDPQP